MKNFRLITHFLLYAFGSFMVRGISMLVAPIVLRYMPPEDYALVTLLTSIVTVLMPITGLGLRQVFSLEYFHEDEQSKKKLLNTIITIYIVIALPLCLLILFLMPLITQYFFRLDLPFHISIITMFLIFISFFSELFYQLIQYKNYSLLMTLLSIGVAITTMGCMAYCLFFFETNYTSLLYGQCASTLLVCIIACYLYITNDYHKDWSFQEAIKRIIPYLKIGIPFIPSILFSWLLSSADRWILTRHVSLSQVGIYGVACSLSHAFHFLVLYPWRTAYFPFIMSTFKKNEACIKRVEHAHIKTMWWCLAAGFTCVVIAPWCAYPLFIRIIPIAYHKSFLYIRPLLAGQIFLMGSYFASCIIQFHRNNIFLITALFFPTISTIVFNAILIPHYGIAGCAYTSCISYGIYFFITYYYRSRLVKNLSQ